MSQATVGALRAELAINTAQWSAGLNRAGADLGRFGRASASGLSAVTSRTRNFGGAIQNASFQVQDFAVQVAMGTSASRALGQQLPQLLGSFGALGAVSGAAIAIGIPLAASFFSSGNAAKEFETKLGELEKAVAAYRAAIEESARPRADLEAEFGSFTAQAEASIAAIEVRANQAAQSAVKSSLLQAVQPLLDATKNLQLFADVIGGDFTNITSLAQELNITYDEVIRNKDAFTSLTIAIADMLNASSFEEQNAALLRVQEIVLGLKDKFATLPPEIGDMVLQLELAVKASADLGGAMETAGGLINVASGYAASLSTNLADSAAMAEAAAGAVADLAAARTKAYDSAARERALAFAGDDERGSQRGVRRDAATANSERILASFKPATARGGGGGGGGGNNEIEQRARDVKRIFDETRTAAEKYAAALDNLDTLRPALGEDTYARAVRALKVELEGVNPALDLAKSTFDSLFDSIFTGTADAVDALKNLAIELAKMALQKALIGGMPSIFGAGGFFNLTGAFAKGTNSAPGGMALVGESGPELVNLPRGSQVIPNGKFGGGNVEVNIINNAGAEVSQTRSSGPQGQDIINVFLDKVGAALVGGRYDKGLSRFGAKPMRTAR